MLFYVWFSRTTATASSIQLMQVILNTGLLWSKCFLIIFKNLLVYFSLDAFLPTGRSALWFWSAFEDLSCCFKNIFEVMLNTTSYIVAWYEMLILVYFLLARSWKFWCPYFLVVDSEQEPTCCNNGKFFVLHFYYCYYYNLILKFLN